MKKNLCSKLHKKLSFPLRISSVNVTKYAVSCGFGHIYWRNHQWKTSFFVQWYPTFFVAGFKFSWTFLRLPFSIFNKLYSASRDLLFANLFKLIFHNFAWNYLHVIYLYILKNVKISKQRTNWKNSF